VAHESTFILCLFAPFDDVSNKVIEPRREDESSGDDDAMKLDAEAGRYIAWGVCRLFSVVRVTGLSTRWSVLVVTKMQMMLNSESAM
jgi:hypothetical protein